MKSKGIWFYGLSRSGKSFVANIFKKFIKKSFVIDGDFVRSTLSRDLDYSLKSRKTQINRILNISKLCIHNNYYPIITTVYMDKTTLLECKKNLINVVIVKRKDFQKIKLAHKTYKNKKYVVGRDIKLPNLNCYKLKNTGDKKVWTEITLLRKLLKKNAI